MEVVKKKFVLSANALEQESKHIFHWHIFCPDHVEFKELLEPTCWAHNAAKLGPMARITVTSESNKFVGELVVFSAGQLWADVKEVFYKDFDNVVPMSSSPEFELRWVSNSVKYAVVRKSDDSIIQKHLPDLVEGNKALAAQINGTRKSA